MMENEEEQQQGKWAVKLTAKLTGPKPDHIWLSYKDYCNFHRWHQHPTLDVCQHTEGVEGQPGDVRYCAVTSLWHQHPTLDVCQHIEGVEGQPGDVRYCAVTSLSSSNGGEKTFSWAKEKLMAIHPIGRTVTYEIIDNVTSVTNNNTEFGAYVAILAVLAEPEDGCTIQWSCEAHPVEDSRVGPEALVSFYEFALQGVAKRMGEDALSQIKASKSK
ncbi:hypothetical protein MRB53_017743 [Persea americana]|uniref:Uncharacterized protein n=1 Tax=Persea americana TaxID=3435 RepID=A0ACC2M5V1_PERAE|nr:hypothetical protein MRB53_017743 [Persea americana]